MLGVENDDTKRDTCCHDDVKKKKGWVDPIALYKLIFKMKKKLLSQIVLIDIALS